MKPVPHDHLCFGCWKETHCMNPHCEDLEYKWCQRGGCEMPESMRESEALMTAGHLIHEAQFILEQGRQGTEAYQADWLRRRILRLLNDEQLPRLVEYARTNKEVMQNG